MISAFVLVNCHFPFDSRIMNEIRMKEGVSNVYRTEGRYDLIAKVSAESQEKLKEIIDTNIGKVNGVDGTIQLTVTKQHLPI